MGEGAPDGFIGFRFYELKNGTVRRGTPGAWPPGFIVISLFEKLLRPLI